MKHNIRILSLAILMLSGISLMAQDSTRVSKEIFIKSLDAFPSFEKISQWFFMQYRPTKEDNIIRFAKDPRGWYVYEIKPSEPGFIYNKQQIWSLEKLAYRRTNYRPVEDQQKAMQNMQKNVQPRMSRLYKIHPFYGYNGWDRDVVFNMGDYQGLPDTLLYGLARAYSNLALSAIRHQYEYTTSEHKPAGYEKISEKRLTIFTENIDKAIDTYKQLQKQNPDFETIVGPVSLKFNNEMMFAWQTLLSVQEPELAEKYLHQVDYDDFTLAIANNYLQSVSPNGILFTFGDNDTYPLWFLQHKKQLRTDINVINISLLNTAWYVAMLKDELKASGKDGLISFTDDDFENDKMNIAYYIEDKAKFGYLKITDFIAMLRSGDYLMEVSSERDITYLPGNSFKLGVDRGSILEHYQLSDENKLKLQDTLRWTINRSYLMRSELVLLDMLSNNNWQYPIHYSFSGESRYFMGLDDYMQLHGITYKLVPNTPNDDYSSLMGFHVNPERSYKLIMEDFSFGNPQNVKPSNGFAHRVVNLLRSSAGSVASVLMGQNKKDSALMLLNRIDERIPATAFPYNYFCLSHAELYLQLEQNEKATAIMDAVAEEQMEKIRKLSKVPANSPKVNAVQQELRMARAILQQIITLCDKYELKERYKKYSDFQSLMSH